VFSSASSHSIRIYRDWSTIELRSSVFNEYKVASVLIFKLGVRVRSFVSCYLSELLTVVCPTSERLSVQSITTRQAIFPAKAIHSDSPRAGTRIKKWNEVVPSPHTRDRSRAYFPNNNIRNCSQSKSSFLSDFITISWWILLSSASRRICNRTFGHF